MAIGYAKPLPAPDPDTQPFWDACRAHELRAQRCAGCGAYRWPPQAVCPECYSWDFTWERLAETGTVDTFTVTHYVAVPSFVDDAPFVVAHITIDGTDNRVRLVSNVVDVPWQQVRVGMRVRVRFDDVTPEITLPKFEPVEQG
jgi:uncharacterized OB-fold protein